MSGVVKAISKEMIEMRKAGMKIPAIMKAVNGSYPQVISTLRRAEERGDLPFGSTKREVPLNCVADVQRMYDVKLGSMGKTMQTKSTHEIWVFAAEQTLDGGYGTVAEYLIDLLIEAYYEQRGAK